jgi:hypothetical protein
MMSGVSNQVNRWDGRCSICKKSTAERFVQINSRVEYGDILAQFWCIQCLEELGRKK